MIRTFKSRALKRYWIGGQDRAIAPDYRARVRRILLTLDQARTAEDMNVPGWRLHRLTGELTGYWSVRVSANWRITFRVDGRDVFDVDFVDYH